ncbi:MAG: formylglycine-generating enzyme family protein [Marinilabilia sp.]
MQRISFLFFFFILVIFSFIGCSTGSSDGKKTENQPESDQDEISGRVEDYENTESKVATTHSEGPEIPEGMVLIPGGTFSMGAREHQFAKEDEYPPHQVRVDSFLMDKHPVTNAQFREFVEETGYVTIAEQKPDWEEMKKELPSGYEKPPDSLLVPGSMVFRSPSESVSRNDFHSWWEWVPGANWRNPFGPDSDIDGLDNHPVVHVTWSDAMAYAEWAGKRLPTEAEWEFAASGGENDHIYPWGNEPISAQQANYWQGDFPRDNYGDDGFYSTSPVMSFAPNPFGLYDMAGNVWEWVHDWYHHEYYKSFGSGVIAENPEGPAQSYDPMEPGVPKKSMRGGSFLCNDSYCAGYRVSARMKTTPSTGMVHLGFRCVKDF